MERATSLAEPGRARLGRPRGGGTERRVLSPEAAVLCQAGRVASDAVPRLSAQVVEQQHRLVCFCANSSPTPRPDHCLFFLCIHMLRHSFPTPTYPLFFLDFTAPFASIHHQTEGDTGLLLGERLLHAFTGAQYRAEELFDMDLNATMKI